MFEEIICSSTLQATQASEIGQQLEGEERSPFLKMGTTKAFFQSSGIIPWFSDACNSIVRQGAISVANSLKNLVGILSGPLAL